MLRHCFLYSAIPADSLFLQEEQNKDQPYSEGKRCLVKSNHELKYGHSLTTLSLSKKKKKGKKYYYGSCEAMGYMQFESIL